MATDNKKIAKNTMMLYIRMLLIMAVTLYTSRVILKVLGIEDYGIYNLIAGFVTFLVFISNSLVSAMQRYFNVALGQNNPQRYKEVFSMSLNILFLFSLLIIALGESIGLWFVHNYLNIPEERFTAAMWVYQISLLTFVANTLRTPFHASIIAHEKMSFYAYISLLEVSARLGMVYLLMIIHYDHLITYAFLYLLVIVLVNCIYIFYCRRKFHECKYKWNTDKELFKELVSFSGWTLMGQASVVVKNQGEAIFVNRFFFVAANAAMGVAVQVANALELFVSNFQTAFNPQLIQSYASQNYIDHKRLLFRASKFSFFLLFILVVPLVANIDFVLNLWLVDVPEYTNYFIDFILISYLLGALSTPFVTSILATGKIKHYQMILSVTFLCGLVLVYIFLKLGFEPYYVSVVAVIIQICLLFIRLWIAKKYVGISLKEYLREVIIPVVLVTVLSVPIPYLLNSINEGSLFIVINILIEVAIIGSLILYVGLNRTERNYIINTIKKITL